jgi:hypothetical protein
MMCDNGGASNMTLITAFSPRDGGSSGVFESVVLFRSLAQAHTAYFVRFLLLRLLSLPCMR